MRALLVPPLKRLPGARQALPGIAAGQDNG